MGELVHNSLQDPGHAIQYGDVTYLAHNNTVHIFLRHSKTDQEGKGSSISLTPTLLPICPVRIVQSFMQARPTNPGAFFCHLSGRPVTRYQVASVFNLALKKLGLDNQSYKPHSFRIGAASAAWVSGTSAHDIASKGRWKSHCPRTIWVLGSSIVKHAFCYARKSQYGANLELDRHNATIFWQGKGGMRVEEICSKVKTLLKVQNAPHMLVIHCGGNNIPASKGAKIANTGMFCKEKVHLSGMGNDMFLYRLQQALQAFLNDSSVKVSPRDGQNGPWLRYD
uniref:Tyr recombinase domain-containing protein n=1 Tax=Magallana gigas TaxID=29159 RepID=A0A8W8NS92_MAGGI